MANFASQIAGARPHKRRRILAVGNLKAKRDFLDVRDGARGLALLMRYGRSGEAYNLGSGRSRTVGEVFRRMIRLSGLNTKEVRLKTDRRLMSHNEIDDIRLNVSRLRRLSGFRPQIGLDQTLKDILASW